MFFRHLLQGGRMEDVSQSLRQSWPHVVRAVLLVVAVALMTVSIMVAVLAKEDAGSVSALTVALDPKTSLATDCAPVRGNAATHCLLQILMAMDDPLGACRLVLTMKARPDSEDRSRRAQYRPDDPFRPPLAVSLVI